MARIILPCHKEPGESIDHFDRRKKSLARDFCGRVGFWSEVWAGRCVNWFEHVQAGGRYGFLCHRILSHHNSSWLTTQRSFFVNARNTLFAGQTGQRGVGGRPQPRFESCIDLAKQVLASRKHTLKGKHSLSVGSRVTSAIRFLKGRLESNAPGSSV